MSLLQPNYSNILEALKQRIGQARIKAAVQANTELLKLYWEIGKTILEQQQQEGWGAKVIDNLSRDLRLEFPDFKGLSVRNLKYMRAFAEAYPDFGSIVQPVVAQIPTGDRTLIVQPVVAQIPWVHHILLLDKVKDLPDRAFYMEKTVANGWSKSVLALQIESRLHERQGKAITNFSETLPAPQSDLAREVLRNPYVFDFFGFSEKMRERDIEKALVEHLKDFMLALGKGFSFVGNQVNIRVDGQDFFLDLLFFNYHLNCFVVFELKIGDFEPEHAGKLNFYVNAVNEQLRGPGHQPTFGVLLCKTPNETVVKFALQGIDSPIGVADYELAKALPKELKGEMPSIEELEAELDKGIEELKSPSQKRLDDLKTKLDQLKGESLRTPNADTGILHALYDQSLRPLYEAMLSSFKEFEPLFVSSDYRWHTPNQAISTFEQLEPAWKNPAPLQSLHELIFSYRLRGLIKAGADSFDVHADLRLRIEDYNYNFSFVNRDNNVPFIKKTYHEQLTAADIQKITEASCGWILDQIEQRLERLKNNHPNTSHKP